MHPNLLKEYRVELHQNNRANHYTIIPHFLIYKITLNLGPDSPQQDRAAERLRDPAYVQQFPLLAQLDNIIAAAPAPVPAAAANALWAGAINWAGANLAPAPAPAAPLIPAGDKDRRDWRAFDEPWDGVEGDRDYTWQDAYAELDSSGASSW